MGNQVRVYRNLHKNTYSIQGRTPKGWRVIGHADSLYLTGVSFKVYEKGRQRVLATKRKNVHAFLIGTISKGEPWQILHMPRVRYNPYLQTSFELWDGTPIYSAKEAWLTLGGVYIETGLRPQTHQEKKRAK